MLNNAYFVYGVYNVDPTNGDTMPLEMSESKYVLNNERLYYDDIVGQGVKLTITLEFGPQAPDLLVDNVNEFFEAATEALEDLIGVE